MTTILKSLQRIWSTHYFPARIIGFLLIVSCFSCSCIKEGYEGKGSKITAGDRAPLFTAQMLDGSQLSLEELQGNVVLLFFFSSTCPLCHEEMQAIDSLFITQYANQPFRFLPIARDGEKENITHFCMENGYHFPIALDPDRAIYNLFALKYVPHVFLIDKKGFVRRIEIENHFTTSTQLHQTIVQLCEDNEL